MYWRDEEPSQVALEESSEVFLEATMPLMTLSFQSCRLNCHSGYSSHCQGIPNNEISFEEFKLYYTVVVIIRINDTVP